MMKIEQILQLVEAVSASELTEFKYEENEVKLSLKRTRDSAALPHSAPETAAPACKTETVAAKPDTQDTSAQSGRVITSPLVGTFYAAPSEDSEPFIRKGDSVSKGQVLAIVEAMKLMNEIESEFAGTVEQVLVENGQAVEYGQPLFVIQ